MIICRNDFNIPYNTAFVERIFLCNENQSNIKIMMLAILGFRKIFTRPIHFDKSNLIIRSIYSLNTSKSHTSLLGRYSRFLLTHIFCKLYIVDGKWVFIDLRPLLPCIYLQSSRLAQNVYKSTNKNIIGREFRPVKVTPWLRSYIAFLLHIKLLQWLSFKFFNCCFYVFLLPKNLTVNVFYVIYAKTYEKYTNDGLLN